MTGAIVTVFTAMIVIGCGLTLLWNAARNWRKRRRDEQDAAHAAMACAMACEPCNGRPGTCHCSRRCGHPDCAVPDAVDGKFATVIGEGQ